MRLIHDVDLVVRVGGWGIHRPLPQVARVIYSAVGRCIYLDDIERGRPTPDPCARRAFAARLALGLRRCSGLSEYFPLQRAFPESRLPHPSLLAIQRHCQHTSQRRLTHPSRPAEQISVRNPPAGDRSLERGRDVRLHRNIRERLWAVLPGEGEVHSAGSGKREAGSGRGNGESAWQNRFPIPDSQFPRKKTRGPRSSLSPRKPA